MASLASVAARVRGARARVVSATGSSPGAALLAAWPPLGALGGLGWVRCKRRTPRENLRLVSGWVQLPPVSQTAAVSALKTQYTTGSSDRDKGRA